MKNGIVSFVIIFFWIGNIVGQENKMQWFADAKLGIFIHWGIYAVNGTDESWAFYNKKMSHDEYMKQINGFFAESYDPNQWVDLIKESGARYAVLTSKHHDGVALWNTAANHWSIPKKRASGKRCVNPIFECGKESRFKIGYLLFHFGLVSS